MRFLVLITLFFIVNFSNSWSLEIIDKLFNKTKVYKCYHSDGSGPEFIGINKDFIIDDFDEEEKYTKKLPIIREDEKIIYAEWGGNGKLIAKYTFLKISKELRIDYTPSREVRTISDYFKLSCQLIEN